MKEKLEGIKKEALALIENADKMDKLNEVKVAYLGKKGQLTALLKGMKNIAPEERPAFGQMVNEVRSQLENVL